MSTLKLIDAPELKELPELKLIGTSKADQILNTFQPMAERLKEFEAEFHSIITEAEKGITNEVSARARRLRMDCYVAIRTDTGKAKDKAKRLIKLEDKAIMSVHNMVVWATTEHEQKLKEIEDHDKIQEQKRMTELQNKRVELLSPYVQDAHERDLGNFPEDVWEAYLSSKKQAWEDEQRAIQEAEEKRKEDQRIATLGAQRRDQIFPFWKQLSDEHKKFTTWNLGSLENEEFEQILTQAKKASIADEKRQEAIRKENERLQKEAQEREAKAAKEAKERAKQEAEKEAKLAAERKAESERLAKIQAENEAKLKAEQDARLKAQKELEARQEADRKAKEQEEARIQAELSKGDKSKIEDLLKDLEALRIKYTFRSKKNKDLYSEVNTLIGKVINHIIVKTS